MSFLEKKITDANELNKTAIIPFITAGFPSKAQFWNIVKELDEYGADIIEIGVPFTDPVADGPVVEEASIRALKEGVNIDYILDGLKKENFKAGIVLMGYLNPFLKYGIEKFAKNAKLSGVHGCIIPDMPLEESHEIRAVFSKYDIDLVSLVGLNTTQERMEEYSNHSKGYVYVVSVLGTTGERSGLSPKLAETIMRAKKAFNIPIALGFGLSKPSELLGIPEDLRPNAVIIGSAFLKHIDSGRSAKDFMGIWKN